MSRYTSDELIALCFGYANEELTQRFFSDPNYMRAQGYNGRTILHHAVSVAALVDNTRTFLESWLNKPGADFNIKDNDGNTAVHLAALYIASDRVNLETVFPMYVKKAEELGFDFSTQNERGMTVLHLAAIMNRSHLVLGRKSGVSVVLENTKNPAIDTLSHSGGNRFVLCYRINL